MIVFLNFITEAEATMSISREQEFPGWFMKTAIFPKPANIPNGKLLIGFYYLFN